MRRLAPSLAAICLFAASAASPAHAQANARADICAADDDSAFAPEQRIASCTALIKSAKGAQKDRAPL
ncbi:MAG: hypothetical protein KDJ40_19155, partial [Hyphomicrobiales bacterium]|nr:hypothetical protein [Hyphomicrobiales bacterium]